MINYKNRILVIIITYNPELKFLYNNLKKFEGTDVLIIDNNSITLLGDTHTFNR